MDWQRADQVVTSHLGSVLVIALVAVTAFMLGGQYRGAQAPVAEQQTPVQTETAGSSTISELQQLISTPSKPTVSSATPTAAPTTSGVISINFASQAELETLPGIGPSKANAIISYRLANGPFVRIDDLVNVKGIGPKTLESLRPLISL
ncbi:MAG: ComEA family DNA-binding protein [Patescibacteria group bacterium]